MKKHVVLSFLILSVLFSFLFVSCPNQSIRGQVDKDSRNNTRFEIKGTINEPLTDSRKFTVTLTNATFRAFSRGEDVSDWFVDANGEPCTIDGLKYRIASPVARGSNKATVRISGTPTKASKEQIHLLIPCDTFQGPITINVDTEDSLYYNIIDYIAPSLVLVEEEDNDMVVNAMETKAFTKTIKFRLEHGYFATDTTSYSLEIQKNTENGDGSIVNTKTGGIYLDTPGSGEAFTYKWSPIALSQSEDAEKVNTISLTISGTSNTQRKDETFSVVLKSTYYGTIIDDRGEEFTDDLRIGTTGLYQITELLPSLNIVTSSTSTTPRLDAKITGNADESITFEQQTIDLILYDAILNYSGLGIVFENDNEVEVECKERPTGADSNTVSVKRSDFFTGEYSGKGLNITIAPGTESSGNVVYQYIRVTVWHKQIPTDDDTSEKLSVYEATHKFTIPAGLVIKSIGGASTVYDKAVTSVESIEFKIEEPKPVVEKPSDSSHGVFFTGVVATPVSATMIEDSEGSATTENGGVVKLKNSTSFRFKEELARGDEILIDEDNDMVIIEPRYDFMTYYYKILTSEDDPELSSIKLYVKQSEGKDEDNDPVSPTTNDVTYQKRDGSSSSDLDTAGFAPGTFKDNMKSKYEVKVTLSSALFSQFKPSEIETQAEGDDSLKGEWVDYEGSDVVITPESHIVRYRIMAKEVLTLSQALNKEHVVIYTNESGDLYNVDYTNQGVSSYGLQGPTYLGEKVNLADGFADSGAALTWYLIPNAIPTSKTGKLVGLWKSSSGVFERMYGKFNTPVNYNVLKMIDSIPSYNNKINIMSGLDGNLPGGTSGKNDDINYLVPNSSFNRFTLVLKLPKGYSLVNDREITSNDIRIFSAKKGNWNDGPDYIPSEYDSDTIKIINDNIKFKVEMDDDKNAVLYNAASAQNPSEGQYVPLYIYLDSLTDENNVLTNALYRGTDNGYAGSSDSKYKLEGKIYNPDIRINPSIIKDENGNLLLSKAKAQKTIDGKEYDGDAAKLANKDLWIPISDSNFKILITPVEGEGEYYGDKYELRPLSWQYRIMDRADYTFVSPMFVPNASNQEATNTTKSFYSIYRHTPQTLSVNADMTTGVQKTPGAAVGKYRNGSSHKYLDERAKDGGHPYTINLLVNLEDIETGTGLSSNIDGMRGFFIDGESIPIRELKSGEIYQTKYDEETRPTIPAADLLSIVQGAKRKGYRPAGFARGLNAAMNYGDTHGDSDFFQKNYPMRSNYSDLLPFKGVDDFGNPMDWSLEYDPSGNLITDSGILKDGIHLQLSDARAYKGYIDPTYNTTSASFADWNNTTYIYLVWEKDPNSGYYDVDNSKVQPIGQDEGLTQPMKFVTIPGDLKWLGLRKPYTYENGSKQDVNMGDIRYTNYYNYLPSFSYFGKIEENDNGYNYDFAIADIEMTGELFRTVYDWATNRSQYKYEFSTGSSEVYYPVTKNLYDQTYRSGTLTVERSEFDVDNIYGGKRPKDLNDEKDDGYKLKAPTTATPVGGYSISSVNYTNVEGDDYLQHPVTNVNIYDAMLFCNALTEWYNEKKYGPTLIPAYSSGNNTSSVKRTYNEIKTYMGEPVTAAKINTSESKTGFRLPSYNEWFAAATIVPEVNNFLANAILADGESRLESYYSNRYGLSYTGVLSNSQSGQSSFQVFDTSYPFMQPLYTTSGIYEGNGIYAGLPSGLDRTAYIFGRHNDAGGSENGIGSVAVTNILWPEVGGGKGYIPDYSDGDNFSVLASTAKVGSKKKNALGLYDMSGNVAEWTLGSLNNGYVVLAGGDFAGYLEGAVLGNGEQSSSSPAQPLVVPNSLLLNSGGTMISDFVRRSYDGHSRFYSPELYPYKNGNDDPINDGEVEGAYSSYGSVINKATAATLNINQRSRNVGFRVCRTVLPNEN